MADHPPGTRLDLGNGRTATVGADGVARFDPPAQGQSPQSAIPRFQGDAAPAPPPVAPIQPLAPGQAADLSANGFRVGNTVNLPNAPTPLSEAQRLEEAQRLAKEAAAAAAQSQEVGNTRGKLNEALNLMDRNDFRPPLGEWDNGLLGVYGSMGRMIPGSDANVFNGTLDTIRANLALNKLMEMKANSASGASGLGALTAPELRLIESTITSLDLDRNNPESMREGLGQINRILERAYPDAQPSTERRNYRVKTDGKRPPPRLNVGAGVASGGLGAMGSRVRPAPPRAQAAPANPFAGMSDAELARIANGGR